MRKILFLFLLLLVFSADAASPTYTSRLNLQPTSTIVERKVGASIVIVASGGSSLLGSSVISVMPRVWVTNTGSSVTSFAFGGPPLGPGQRVFVPGQGDVFGGSLEMTPISFIFHAPSIYPAYGSSVQVGNQTYSVSAQILLSDGTTLYPTASTVKVEPMPLPSSQVTGWH